MTWLNGWRKFRWDTDNTPKLPRFIDGATATDRLNVDWVDSLADKCCDNSIGNGATEVMIDVSRDTVTIIDNGRGVSTHAMLIAMAEIGGHMEDPNNCNPVSMHGIGAKHAFLFFGGTTKI